MQKWILFGLLLVFLYGCTIQTPWGDFHVIPNDSTVNQNSPAANVGPGTNTGQHNSQNPSQQSDSVDYGGSDISYFDPGTGSFSLQIDGITTSSYDNIGVVLRPGESPDNSDPNGLFIGDYPTNSPRNLVIKSRVRMGDRGLEKWRSQVASGLVERKAVTLIIRNSNGSEISRIRYSNAWPYDYQLIASANSFEEVVILTSESVAS